MNKRTQIFVLTFTWIILSVSFFFTACGQQGTTSGGVSSTTTAGTLLVTGVNPYSIGQATTASGVQAMTFPSDAEFNCTFSSIKFSSDGITYSSNILSQPLTIDLFSNNVRTGTGTSFAVTVTSGETFSYVKMAVSAITLSAAGQTTRNIMADLQTANPTEDFDGVVMEVLPFTYHGGEIRLNAFVARPANDTDFATWNAREASPTFTFYGSGIEQSSVGTVNITVLDANPGAYLYAQAYRNREQDTAPSFMAPFVSAAATRSVDSRVVSTGTITLPAGSFYLAASASNGPLSAESVASFESTEWTLNGVNRSQSLLTIEAGQTYAIDLSPEADTNPSSEEVIENHASLQIAVTSEAIINLGGQGEFLLFTASTEVGVLDSLIRDVPYMESIEAQSYFSGVVTATYLTPGTYYMILFLDVDDDRMMDYNTDYWYRCPDPITLTNEVVTVIPTDEAWELELFTPGL